MTDAYRLHEPLPSLESPVLVGMFTGWIDASGAAAAAWAAIDAATGARPLVTFDGDLFLDYRARRPTMELREGLNTRLVWPEIVLKVGRTGDGRDVLLLGGAEPDSNWHRFADTVGALAVELGASQVVFLGAYPFACPHSRPSRLSCTTPSPELLASVPFIKSTDSTRWACPPSDCGPRYRTIWARWRTRVHRWRCSTDSPRSRACASTRARCATRPPRCASASTNSSPPTASTSRW
jgi:hypothetical protein